MLFHRNKFSIFYHSAPSEANMQKRSALTAALAGPDDIPKAPIASDNQTDGDSFPCLSKPGSGGPDQLTDGIEALNLKDVPITGSAPTAFMGPNGHAYVSMREPYLCIIRSHFEVSWVSHTVAEINLGLASLLHMRVKIFTIQFAAGLTKYGLYDAILAMM